MRGKLFLLSLFSNYKFKTHTLVTFGQKIVYTAVNIYHIPREGFNQYLDVLLLHGACGSIVG
jgi:hypothetical protein